jgi:hypothetical protein
MLRIAQILLWSSLMVAAMLAIAWYFLSVSGDADTVVHIPDWLRFHKPGTAALMTAAGSTGMQGLARGAAGLFLFAAAALTFAVGLEVVGSLRTWMTQRDQPAKPRRKKPRP